MINHLAHVTRRFHPRGLHRLLKRIPWHGEEVITLNGVKVRVGSKYPVEWGAYWFGEYEPWVAQVIKQHIKPGDSAFDVGCNVGFHTCLMNRLGAKVWAVDTDPNVRERFWYNVQLNSEYNAELNTRFPRGVMISQPEHVDHLLEISDLNVKLIKIDVDGTEPHYLQRFDDIIRRDHPVLIFEYTKEHWDKIGWDLPKVRDWLVGRGYLMWSISRHGTQSWNLVTTDSDMLAVWHGKK